MLQAQTQNMSTSPCYLVIELDNAVYSVTRDAQLAARQARRLRELEQSCTVFTNAAGRRTLRDLGVARSMLDVPPAWSLARATDAQCDTVCLQWCAAHSVGLAVRTRDGRRVHHDLHQVVEGDMPAQ